MAEDSVASHQEVSDLKMQMTALSVKLDVLSNDISRVNVALARQEGANIPDKVKDIEVAVRGLEAVRDSRAWIGDAVKENTSKIEEIDAFRYKLIGVILVSQTVLTVVGGAVIKWILSH